MTQNHCFANVHTILYLKIVFPYFSKNSACSFHNPTVYCENNTKILIKSVGKNLQIFNIKRDVIDLYIPLFIKRLKDEAGFSNIGSKNILAA